MPENFIEIGHFFYYISCLKLYSDENIMLCIYFLYKFKFPFPAFTGYGILF